MIYAVGDIHGNFKMLNLMYKKIREHIDHIDDPLGAKIIFLGDYIDRGDENVNVIHFLDGLKDEENLEHIFLFGNHEQMMIEAEHNVKVAHMWWQNGGATFLKELNIDFQDPHAVFDTKEYKYINKWIKNKTVALYNDVDYVFVHGALEKNVSIEKQREDFLVWGRMTPEYYDDCNKMVVHGHTPPDDLKPYKYNNVVNVDIGCGFRNHLACVALPHIRDDDKIEFIIVR